MSMPTPTLNQSQIYEFKVPEAWSGIWLFMPYDLVIRAEPNIILEIGRFSHALLPHIYVIGSRSTNTNLKVGAFCEAASNASIQVGGEHRNSDLLNYSYGVYCDHHRAFMTSEDLELCSPVSRSMQIGDNVVMSRSAILTSSASVGTGCVIGAGALVVGRCESLGIYGGVPARRLRDRFDHRMTNLYDAINLPYVAGHSVTGLPTKLAAVQSGHMSIDEFRSSVDYLPARPRIHLRATIARGVPVIQEIAGFSVGDFSITDPGIEETLRGYFNQAMSKPTSIRWSPDIFGKLKLY